MASNGGARPTSLISWLVGTLGGLSALMYLAGIVAVTMRLVFLDQPFEAAVSDLPQSYLLTVALIELAVPSLIAGGLYLFGRGILGSSWWSSTVVQTQAGQVFVRSGFFRVIRRLTGLTGLQYDPKLTNRHLRLVVVSGTVTWLGIAVYYTLFQGGNPLTSWGFWIFGGFISVIVSLLCHEVALLVPNRTHGAAVATVAVLAAGGAMPYVVAMNSVAPLDSVKICPLAGAERTGRLVGENGDRIWIIQRTPKRRELVWLQLNSVQSVLVGGEVTNISCASPAGPSPSPGASPPHPSPS